MADIFFEHLFARFNTVKVAVVGDIMLDVYWWGNVDRISPEAPVPIVALNKKESRLGGAANVALNLRALDTSVQIFSVIGKDSDGDTLLQLLQQNGIHTRGVLQSEKRLTTSKARVISRNQQMLRLDAEQTNDLAPEEEASLIQSIKEAFADHKPDIVIFEDYNKGVLTAAVIKEIMEQCRLLDIPTCVDPKLKNFLAYKGVTIFKPNLKEIREGLRIMQEVTDAASLQQMHERLQQHLLHQVSFITLSEKGVFYQCGQDSGLVSSHFRNIADVSGAGDTVIATAAVVWVLTGSAKLMAEIANIAGGLVCEEVGVVAINKALLQKECELLLQAP
jgi:rfaE bifunctional protein kinase chain/domain